jgi:hypothetical protein
MKTLVVCILGCGLNANPKNVKIMLESLQKNIGMEDYQFYIFCNDEQMAQVYIDNIEDKSKIYAIKIDGHYFSDQINLFAEECYGKFKYFLYCHDDIRIDSPNFISISLETAEKNNKIGWITYTNRHHTDNKSIVSNSVRCGVYADRTKYPRVFECHTNDINNLDYPKAPVKVFGPFTHINLIKFDAFKEIGKLDLLTYNSLLIDEDHHCLQTIIKGFINVWIPNIFYNHPLNFNERKTNSIGRGEIIGKVFMNKWCLEKEDYTDRDVNNMINRYPLLKEYTNNSYDWNYL